MSVRKAIARLEFWPANIKFFLSGRRIQQQRLSVFTAAMPCLPSPPGLVAVLAAAAHLCRIVLGTEVENDPTVDSVETAAS